MNRILINSFLFLAVFFRLNFTPLSIHSIYSANDICMESKRSTVNANDVLKAMEEVELPHLMDVLRNKLQGKKINYAKVHSK